MVVSQEKLILRQMVLYIYPVILHQEFFTLFLSCYFPSRQEASLSISKNWNWKSYRLGKSQIRSYLIILGTPKNFVGIKPLWKLMVNLQLSWKDWKIVKVIISTTLVTDSFGQFQVALSDIFVDKTRRAFDFVAQICLVKSKPIKR